MPAQLRVTNEEVVAAYQKHGSIWKAAKALGICGQSLWERLNALGFKMAHSKWTYEEIEELKILAPQCTIGEIGRRLGRSYAAVACKVSELQLGVRYGNRIVRTKRGSGMTKAATAKYLKELQNFSGSIRQFCVQRGFDIETLVQGIQRHHPDEWAQFASTRSDLEQKKCPQCRRDFIPMNSKQKTCSRRCSSSLRVDAKYFGGRRSEAIGIVEGICQLCEKEKPRLAAHHVMGKENDADNQYLVALCAGCHALVGATGVRSDSNSPAFWENLISLALMRKNGHRKPLGFHVCVDIDPLTEEDIEEDESAKRFPGEGDGALEIPGAVVSVSPVDETQQVKQQELEEVAL